MMNTRPTKLSKKHRLKISGQLLVSPPPTLPLPPSPSRNECVEIKNEMRARIDNEREEMFDKGRERETRDPLTPTKPRTVEKKRTHACTNIRF